MTLSSEQLRFIATVDGIHKTLSVEQSGESVLLASVALSVVRGSPAARNAWNVLCAEAIGAAEVAALEKSL